MRNLLLRAKFSVRKIIIFFTSWLNIGCANAQPCALGSTTPVLVPQKSFWVCYLKFELVLYGLHPEGLNLKKEAEKIKIQKPLHTR